MRVEIGSRIHITEPVLELRKWCADNLVVPNPEYAKKLNMGFWVGNTPETLYLYETRGTDLILPFGTLRAIWPMIYRTAVITTSLPEPRHVDFGGTDVPLYDYQEEAVSVLKTAAFGILQSAAGSGKTQMGIALAKRFSRPTLWLTHTADLLTQSMERAALYVDRNAMGTITAGRVNIGKAITFATVQTMAKLDLTAYADLWDVVIVDECHHVAGTPTQMTQFYRVLNTLKAGHKYGLSATVHRSDGMVIATRALLGDIVYTVPDEAVADRIMRVTVEAVPTGTPESEEYLLPDGMISYTMLVNYLCEDAERNGVILGKLEAEKDKPSLILSHRLEHLYALMHSLPPDMRDMAVMVNGTMVTKTKRAERERAMADMRTGKKRYLFATYSLAKEGLDIPCLSRLYLTTPAKDEAVIIQAVGRIARTCEGKKTPIAYDFVDNIHFCRKAWKQRVRHYHKIGCVIV